MRVTATALIVLLVLAGCAAAPPPPLPQVNGTVTTPIDLGDYMGPDGRTATIGAPCTPADGYDDIASGAQVIVTDASGEIVGTGSLGASRLQGEDGGSLLGASCEFPFAVSGIPAGSDFYGVRVGNANRGEVVYTADELAAGVELTIGG